MKLSYFSYDFVECCCEAVNACVCAFRFHWAGLLDVPMGGGLAPLTPVPTPNFARNSPTTLSNFEFQSLELQRFWALLKLQPIELRASFRRQRRAATHGHRSQTSSSASRPHKRDKIRPARLHQHPRAKKFAQRTQNTPKSAFFRLLGEFFRGLDQNPLLLGEFFRAHEHPRAHPRRTLRSQPKPLVACALATTPVAHWPHD